MMCRSHKSSRTNRKSCSSKDKAMACSSQSFVAYPFVLVRVCSTIYRWEPGRVIGAPVWITFEKTSLHSSWLASLWELLLPRLLHPPRLRPLHPLHHCLLLQSRRLPAGLLFRRFRLTSDP